MTDENDHWSAGIEGLAPELANDPRTLATPDVATAIKRMLDNDSEVSRRVRLPSENASDDDWAKFRDKLGSVPGVVHMKDGKLDAESLHKLGVPESPAGYEIPELVATALNLDEESGRKWREKAHELGVTGEQLQGLLGFASESRVGAVEEAKANALKAADTLKTEWAEKFHDKMMQARLAAEKYDLGTDIMENPLIGSDQRVMNMLADVGESLREDRGINDYATPGGGAKMTQSEAQAQIYEIRNNPNHPYYDRLSPEHEDAIQFMARLHEVVS